MIAPMLVSALLNTYAPRFPKSVAAGIISVESYGDAWALDDDTAHRSYHPRTYAEAVTLAHSLIDSGHSVDLGLAQCNSVHLGEAGVTVEALLHPGPNLVASQRIFLRDLTVARGDLRSALSLYNSGSPTYSLGYADKVLAAISSSYGAAIVAGGPLLAISTQVATQVATQVVRRASSIGTTSDAFRGTPW